jgi:hypothetical protein
MKRCRWPLMVTLLALAGIAPARPAQAAPPVPKALVVQNFKPGPGRYVSTVDNFDGLVAGSNVQGTGKDNMGNTLYWEADMRAMQGVYIDSKGLTQRGTFVFT